MSGPPVNDTSVRATAAREAPWWATSGWWLASVVAALLHNGIWATPNLAFVALISENPGENPFEGALAGDYLLTDVSLTRLAWLTQQTEPHEVARLHLAVLLVGWAAVVALARSSFGHRAARTLTVVLAASPLVTVSMQWLGQPDPLTGLCGVAMVLVRRRWLALGLGVLAGVTHPEQALFMAGVAGSVRCFLPPRHDRPGDTPEMAHDDGPGVSPVEWLGSIATTVGGVAIGATAVQLWLRVAGIALDTPRSDYLDYGLRTFWEHHLTSPAGLVWTLWGPLWLLVVAVGVREYRRRTAARGAWLLVALFALAALLPVFVTLDETRVYAVITAPLLSTAAVWIAATWEPRLVRAGSALLLALTAMLPGGFATGATSWRHQLDSVAMAAFLVDGSIDGTVPEDSAVTPWLLEPFDFEIPDPPG